MGNVKRVVLQHMSLNKVDSYQVEEEMDFGAKPFGTSKDGTISSRCMKSRTSNPEELGEEKMATMQTTIHKSTVFGLSPPSESRIMLRRWKQPINRAILRDSESS